MLWPTSWMLATRRSRASRLACSATAGVTMPPRAGSLAISRIGQVIASTVSRQGRGGAHRASRRGVEDGEVELRLDVDPVVARLGIVLRPLRVGVGVPLGRAHRLDGADPVNPALATQRRAAAGGVRGRAKSRR